MANQFMGLDGFVWFTGVVEDRNDPAKLGRVRVRCVGFHTEDLNDIPTKDLPWAHVMHPVTDPSMQGLGNTPSFLVEGTWVIGFFSDANNKQQPIIIGSLPGNPESAADPREGFNDPRGIDAIQTQYKGDPTFGPYPVDGVTYTMPSGHRLGEPDTNRLAQGKNSESHKSLSDRRTLRLRGNPNVGRISGDGEGVSRSQKDDRGFAASTGEGFFGGGVPTATKPNLSAVSDVAESETRGFWEEPQPKGIADGLIIGERFINGDNVCLHLADNIYYGHDFVPMLRRNVNLVSGAVVLVYQVKNPKRYGVIEFDEEGNIIEVE